MKPKYIITTPYEMESYYKEGYEFLSTFTEVIPTVNYSTTSSVNGFIGDKAFHGSINNNNAVYNNTYTTKVIMQLSKACTALFGEKRENNT